MNTITFQGFVCVVFSGKYSNGNTRLQLWSEEEGPIATATIDLGEKLPKDQAYIKDYSENDGMLDTLIESGIVARVLDYKMLEYISVPLCKLNLEKCI